MVDIFRLLIEQLNSAVFVLLALVAVVGCMLYQGGKFVGKAGKLSDLHDKYHEDIPYLKTRVDLIYQHTFPNAPIQTSSPSHLTAAGEAIADKLNAQKILEMYDTHLSEEVNRRHPHSLYDLQEACFQVAESYLPKLLSHEEMEAVKSISLDYGIPIDSTLSVIGVLLRDKLEQNLPQGLEAQR